MYRTFKAFTLLELLIVTAVSGVLIMLIVTAYLTGARIFSQELGRTDIFWDSQRAVETMTEKIRECQTVTDPQTDRITFWWQDLNTDASPEADELVTYSVSGESLLEEQNGLARSLANNVRSLAFTYDDVIRPKLVTTVLTLSNEGSVLTIESSARVRNE